MSPTWPTSRRLTRSGASSFPAATTRRRPWCRPPSWAYQDCFSKPKHSPSSVRPDRAPMPRVGLPTGVGIYYESIGAGEPVLLIMGTGADHSLWDDTARAYAQRYRVITFDNRGTGQSDHPHDPEHYTMRLLAEDAAGLLDALDIDSAHI